MLNFRSLFVTLSEVRGAIKWNIPKSTMVQCFGWLTRQDDGSRDVRGDIFFFRVGHNEVHENHIDVWIKIKFQLGDLSRPFGLVFLTNAFLSIYEKYENFPPFDTIFKYFQTQIIQRKCLLSKKMTICSDFQICSENIWRAYYAPRVWVNYLFVGNYARGRSAKRTRRHLLP